MTHLPAIQTHFIRTLRSQVRPFPFRETWATRRLMRQLHRAIVVEGVYTVRTN